MNTITPAQLLFTLLALSIICPFILGLIGNIRLRAKLKKLEADLRQARWVHYLQRKQIQELNKRVAHWRANHDNQKKLKKAIVDQFHLRDWLWRPPTNQHPGDGAIMS
jgi:hypothetical protein